jgi:hypothetical protein
VLARRSYLSMTNRSITTPMPARNALGQRSLELPTVLVTNQLLSLMLRILAKATGLPSWAK